MEIRTSAVHDQMVHTKFLISLYFMFILDVFLCKLHSILFECVLACCNTHIAIRILNIHSSVVIGNEISICITHITGMTLEV